MCFSFEVIFPLFLPLFPLQSASIERARQYPLDHRGQESFLVIVVFFICFGVTIALLLLGGWNMYLVGRGETAIEFYTNKRDAVDYKHAGKVRIVFVMHESVILLSPPPSLSFFPSLPLSPSPPLSSPPLSPSLPLPLSPSLPLSLSLSLFQQKFVNPYNHGFKKNWYLFLGLNSRRYVR